MRIFIHFFGVVISLLHYTTVMSQTFLNGSFENTTASLTCNYNLTNPNFNSLMSNTNGFGVGEELDILINGCYTTNIPDGIRALGFADLYDEAALTLSSPLTVGTSYTISFWVYAATDVRPLGNLEIGASTTNNSFGTSLGVISPSSMSWSNHMVTFSALNNATFITVRNQMDGIIHWNHVDNFSFVNPLAVKLESFDVTNENDRRVKLNWVTNSEENSDYFIIQKSKDGLNWEVLNEYTANGNFSSKTNYLEYDYQPYSGTSYYRLIEVDFNGDKEYFNIKSIHIDKDESNQLNLFPNPSSESFKVNIITEDLSQISIINILGQNVLDEVRIENFGSSIGCDIRNLKAGIYYLIFNGKTTSFVKN